jgi:Arabinose efflux permease
MKVYAVVVLALLFQTSYQGNIVLTTLYAVHLKANPGFLGLIVALSAVFPMILAVYSGRLSDRIGFRLPLVFGMIGSATALFLPFLVQNQLYILLVSQSLFGLCQIFTIVTIQNLIGALSDSKNYSKNFSVLSQGTSIGELLGSLVTGFSIDRFQYGMTYVLLSTLALIPGIVFLSHVIRLPKPTRAAVQAKKKFLDLFGSRSLRKTFITSGIILTGIFMFEFYFPVYGRSIHLSASLIGIVLSANTAAYFIVRLFVPKLMARYSEEHVLGICLLLSSIGFLLIPLFKSYYLLIALSFSMGLGLGCCQPLSMAMAYHSSPRGRTGEVLGIRLTVNKFAQVVVPIVSGPMGGALGVLPVFWSNAALFIYGGWSMFDKRLNHPSDVPDDVSALSHSTVKR